MFELIGHLSFSLVALSFWLRDILLLRAVSIVASLAAITYQLTVPEATTWMIVNWNILFVAINSSRITLMIKERLQISFSDKEEELRKYVFPNLSAVEFHRLVHAGEWCELEPKVVLTEQGKECKNLMLVDEGEAEVVVNDKVIARLRRGSFIGEMSFTTNDNASATVRTSKPTCLISWDHQKLRELLRKNPAIGLSLQAVFASDMAKKLKKGPA